MLVPEVIYYTFHVCFLRPKPLNPPVVGSWGRLLRFSIYDSLSHILININISDFIGFQLLVLEIIFYTFHLYFLLPKPLNFPIVDFWGRLLRILSIYNSLSHISINSKIFLTSRSMLILEIIFHMFHLLFLRPKTLNPLVGFSELLAISLVSSWSGRWFLKLFSTFFVHISFGVDCRSSLLGTTDGNYDEWVTILQSHNFLPGNVHMQSYSWVRWQTNSLNARNQ